MTPHRLALAFLLSGLATAAALEPPAGWRPFSPESPWNQPIPADAALDPDSAALVADFSSRGAFHINLPEWSVPVYFVDAAATPLHDVGDSRPGVYGRGFEFPRRIPIPDGAIASPPVGEYSDNHLCIVDPARRLEWGMWAARRDASGRWFTGLGAVTDLSGTGVAQPWFDSPREFDSHRARASGFPLIAGLIRVDEIRAGRIDHALAFAYDHCRTEFFVPPASTAQVTVSKTRNDRGIPMGGRIQLDPAWDVEHSALSPTGKIIARALQRYGAYCGDYADANVLFAENAPGAVAAFAGLLQPGELEAVFTPEMMRQHFRVLDLGQILPGQNLVVPPPYFLSFDTGLPGMRTRIDFLQRRIEVLSPAGTDLRANAPRFRVFRPGTKVFAGMKELDDGTHVDLSQPLALTLRAPDGTSNEWIVTPVPAP